MSTTAPPHSRTSDRSRSDKGTQPLPELHVPRPAWQTGYTALLVVLDGLAMTAATLTAKISWLGINPESFHVRSVSIPYGALALVTVPAWIVLLALAGAYDLGPFGTSSRSWNTVVRAGAQLLALVAVSYYILHLEMLGRGVLVGLVPLAVALTMAERARRARFGLGQLRRRGRARRSALIVGPRHGVEGFVRQLDANPTAGVSVAGISVLGGDDLGPPEPDEHPATDGEPQRCRFERQPGGPGERQQQRVTSAATSRRATPAARSPGRSSTPGRNRSS